jgi:hypothetical protein
MIDTEIFAYSLSRIRWDIFATLTFKGQVPRPAIAKRMCFRHLREAAKITSQPYCRLLIALRQEHGEKNGRLHFHYLLGGTQTRNAITLGHQLEHAWKGSTGGIVECRPYDRSRSGPEYITKCLKPLWIDGANGYEVGKFAQADEVILSRSVAGVIRSLDRMGTDAAERTSRTNGRVLSPSPGTAG